MLVLKYDYDVKLWRHKERTPKIKDHQMPLNETSHETFLRTSLFVTTGFYVLPVFLTFLKTTTW